MRSVMEGSELVGDVKYENFLSPDSLKNEGVDSYDGDNLHTARKGLKFFKDDLSGLESEPRTIRDGEIYVPLGHKTVYKCEIGDKFTARFGEKKYSFTLKGFVEEPMGGASGFGGSKVFISDSDFAGITEESKAFATAEKPYHIIAVCIGKSENYEKSVTKLARELTLELKEKTGYVMSNTFTGDTASARRSRRTMLPSVSSKRRASAEEKSARFSFGGICWRRPWES